MKRLIVRYKDGYVNIPATDISAPKEMDGFVVATNGTELVCIFDIGSIEMLWISEEAK